MQKITPNLWFKGVAAEAVDFYLTVFPNSKILSKTYYPREGLEDFQKDFAGQVLTITFEIFSQQYVAINAGPDFTFNEAVSFNISCESQEEIDYYWSKLTEGGGQESMCGWCRDKYGLSWQINPADMEALMQNPVAFKKLMGMKKIIIKDLAGA